MGYTLKAYLGKTENLNSILERFSEAQIVDLKHGFSLIPMTEELFDEINNDEASAGISTFEFLDKKMEQKTIELVGDKEIAYVESDFFGGKGGHIGIIWKNKQCVFLGKFKKGTMNKVLKKLGVIRTLLKDEFETVGLDKNRHTEDWIE
ncbi:hypothetical protein L3X37_02735 [Sabulilitoribacter arenilitoris]|uniref:Uncharacterized protein n=2 Tax=Flavobacteriaceae TaxID=49546 RepID=A0A8J7JAK9_9FLAO|nr:MULTISPECIES: hypothetical protein [Flavobacteriaceae]MBJ6367504.1 hypothetical protein [Snuella sedimenti]MCF7567282.1 hypothetical protein [Wocania arenilitoris]